MKIDSGLAGTLLKNFKTEIHWRDTTNYAAAVQDDNPVYFDDTRNGGIAAHPVFPVSVTWPVIGNLGEFIESQVFPKEILMTQVHYTERLIIHRLIRPGDRLTISGHIAAILPHRSGAHAVIKLEAIDDAGQPVFTEYSGAMLRGVACDNGKGAEQLLPLPENDREGEVAWEAEIYIPPSAPYVYDGCSNIVFPIHTSPDFAKSVGLPGIILQGTATFAHAVREIVNREADGNPHRVFDISCRFTGMVMPGTHIRICCTGKKKHKKHTDVFFDVFNAENRKAVRSGCVQLR